jgi:hypothetical protein
MLLNRFQTYKNPDENPGLPMILKILKKNQKPRNYCQIFVISTVLLTDLLCIELVLTTTVHMLPGSCTLEM